MSDCEMVHRFPSTVGRCVVDCRCCAQATNPVAATTSQNRENECMGPNENKTSYDCLALAAIATFRPY
jgi:hypothetical protein